MIDRSFPGWSGRVVFWQVPDLDGAPPDDALVRIERHVTHLVHQLHGVPPAKRE
jgi:hypothetical protein